MSLGEVINMCAEMTVMTVGGFLGYWLARWSDRGRARREAAARAAAAEAE